MKRTEKWEKVMFGNQFAKGHKPNKTTFKKGLIPWNKGKKLSERTKEKVRKANIGKRYGEETKEKHRLAFIGENNPRWKGGITPINSKIRNSVEFRLWREAVFARDSWTCLKCNQKGGKLTAHHILNFAQYPELRFAIDNGITFCRKCHREFHHIYGIKNNHSEQIKEFIKNYLMAIRRL